MVTPIDDSGNVDIPMLRKLVRYFMTARVDGLVPLGGSGEYTALSPMDRVRVVETVTAEVGGHVPIIAGVLSSGFKDAVINGLAMKNAGADAIMLLTPFYVNPSQQGLREYYSAFIKEVDIPVIIYDIPYRTGVTLAPETIKLIAEDNRQVIGVKACNTDLAHFNQMLVEVGDMINVLSGEEYHFFSHILLGAKGGIIASANAIPEYWVDLFRLIKSGDIETARVRHFEMLPFLNAIFSEVNPGPLKAVMRLFGFDVGQVLRPLMPPKPETLEKLKLTADHFKKRA